MSHVRHRATSRKQALVAVALAVVFGPPSLARAQPPAEREGSGVIEGRVRDAATGDPLPGAKVMLTDSVGEASTDRQGIFRLASIPEAGALEVPPFWLLRRRVQPDAEELPPEQRQPHGGAADA
jgi:Carboxypeptidase regulatory-like domain